MTQTSNKLQIKNLTHILDLEKNSANTQAIYGEFNSTYEIIQKSAAEFKNKPALSLMLQGDKYKILQTFNYSELFAKVNQTANLFTKLGANKDTVIALILPNLAQTHFCLWGGEASGIVMPINPMLEPEAIVGLLKTAKAKILVTLAPFPGVDIWQKVEKILPDLPEIREVVLINLAYQVQGFKGKIAKLIQKSFERKTLNGKKIQQLVPQQVNIHRYDKIINEQNPLGLDSKRQFDAKDYSSFFCTGGTTGLPKIAMRNHNNEIANTLQVRAMFGENTMDSNKTVLSGLPLFHVNAVLATGLYPFMRGAHVILATPQGFRDKGIIPNFWRLVEHHKINFFAAVPTIYTSLLNYPVTNEDLSSLEFGISGTAPLPVQVFKDFENLTKIKILEGYGLTEGTCVSSVNPPLGARKIGSVGLRLPTQDLQIVHYDAQNPTSREFKLCNANEKGLVVISGDNIFLGYFIEEQNENIWLTDSAGKKWLNTGDLGYLDEEGYLFLTGRQKEMILRGGHNIDPKSIEEIIYTHPSVAYAAAIGKPDSYAGELPVLYVELKPNAVSSSEDIMEYAKANIGERAAIPKEVHIIETMPLTMIGKVFKPELKRLAIYDRFMEDLNNAKISAEIRIENNAIYGLEVKINLHNKEQKADVEKLFGVYAIKVQVE